MIEPIISDLLNRLLSGPFCCVIIIAPGLLIPIYKWLKSIMKKEKEL